MTPRRKATLEAAEDTETPVEEAPTESAQTQDVPVDQMAAGKESNAAIDKFNTEMAKRFGTGAVRTLKGEAVAHPAVSTGSLALDIALGIGGVPRGRITEIYGPESSGKTTLATHICAEAQKAGRKAKTTQAVCYVDMEHALDAAYAEALGLDLSQTHLTQPDNGEQALEIAEAAIRSGAFCAVVVDSVAALVPQSEIEGDMGDATMGKQARLMSQALRKLSGVIKKTNTTVIFINQLRMKIGVMFGNPETTTGGMALKFYSSVRLDIRSKEKIKDGTNVLGIKSLVKVVKNKVAPPFREAMIEIYYGRGIDPVGELVALGVDFDVVQKRGNTFSYKDERIGVGRDNVIEIIRNDPALAEAIRADVMTMFAAQRAQSVHSVSDDEAEPEATEEI